MLAQSLPSSFMVNNILSAFPASSHDLGIPRGVASSPFTAERLRGVPWTVSCSSPPDLLVGEAFLRGDLLGEVGASPVSSPLALRDDDDLDVLNGSSASHSWAVREDTVVFLESDEARSGLVGAGSATARRA